MRESALVRKIIEKVRAAYPTAYVRKFADRFTRGLPDLLIQVQCDVSIFKDASLLQSATLFVEAKTVYGRVGAIQVVEANKIAAAGGRHIFARSPEEVLNELEAMGAVR